MSTPLVTIITPTHCRPAMFSECAAAVLSQTFTDWVWWVVFNWEPGGERHVYPWDPFEEDRVIPIMLPLEPGLRSKFHVPARIVNWLYPKVTTPYIYFLADDDLIDPDGLGVLVKRAYQDYSEDHLGPIHDSLDAVYGRCEVVDQKPDGSYKTACWCYEAGDVGLGTGINPHCLLDGGQVLHTKALWDRATTDGWQLTDSKDDAAGNDGTLLNRLAEFARFHYVPQKIVTHRRHPGASYHRPQESK